MAYPPIPFLPTPPQPGDDEQTFDAKAFSWTAALDNWTTSANAAGAYIDDKTQALQTAVNAAESSAITAQNAESTAVASANFKGAWSGLSGALSVPASVSHEGALWLLLSNVANVAANEPGTSSVWRVIDTAGAFERFIERCTIGLDFAKGRYFVDDGAERVETTDFSQVGTAIRNTVKNTPSQSGDLNSFEVDKIARSFENEGKKGLLHEVLSTNYFLENTDFTANFSVAQNAVIKTPDVIAAPDGTFTGCLVEGSASVSISTSADSFYVQAINLPSGSVSAGFYLKKHPDSGSELSIRLRSISDSVDNFTTVTLRDEWTYVDAGALHNSAGGSYRVYFGGLSKFYIWAGNIENSSRVSSLIITGGTPSSRGGDSISCNVGARSDGFSFIFSIEDYYRSDSRFFLALGKDNSSYIGIGYNATIGAFLEPFTGSCAFSSPISSSDKTIYGVSINLIDSKSAEVIIVANGSVVFKQDFSGDVSQIKSWTNVSIGSRFGSFSCDSLLCEYLYYSPYSSTTAELEALTAGGQS